MRKLIVFNHVSLDGYFTNGNGQFDWARHGNDDPEYAAFVAQNASGEGHLLFGRVTYELMVSYWPTPIAEKHMPEVARGMNSMRKTVFSRTLDSVSWNNTQLIHPANDDLAAEVRKLKEQDGPGMVIFGSGSLIAQLAPTGLIDEYQLVVNPVALGKGRSLFENIPSLLPLKLASSRTFKNGKEYLSYVRAA